MKEKVIKCKTLPARIKRVRKIIMSAENTMGSVRFTKRSDHSVRNMSFRLHVKNPSCAPKPSKNKNRKFIDMDNLQLTVLDVNKVIRDKKGIIIGRCAWRTIPLENVERIAVKGKIYNVVK